MRKLFRGIERKLFALYALFVFGRRVNCFGFFKVFRPENVSIGSDCYINYGVFILGHCQVNIGNRVILSARSMIIDSGLDIHSENRNHSHSHVTIEDDVWIGAGAIIMPNVTIGRGSVIGAGSIVTKDVPPYEIFCGNPARHIGSVKKNSI